MIDGDPLTISLNFKGETQVRFVAADVAELEPVSPPAPVVPSGLVLVLYSNDGHSATFCGSVHPGGGSSFVDGPTTSGSGTTADPFRIALTYDCSALRIVQTLEYVNGESEMTARYQVTNRTLQDAAFRVVTYANPHHGQSSLGDGLIDETAPRTLVSYNDAQGSAMAFVEDPSSPWSHYMQGTAADVQDAGLFTPFATGLADSVAQGADDDAVAVQFDKYHSSGLPAGATDTFIVHWAFDRYDGLAVVADAARHVVGQTASVTATSLNHGEPVQGATIRYSVTGANPAAGVVTTGPTGTSPIALTGRAAGLDTLSAYVDNDGDGNRDDDETRAATTLAWSAPASAAAPSGAATGTAPNSPDFASALRTGLAKAAARLQRMRKKALVRERRFSSGSRLLAAASYPEHSRSRASPSRAGRRLSYNPRQSVS